MFQLFVGHKDQGHLQAYGGPDQQPFDCTGKSVRIDIYLQFSGIHNFFDSTDDAALQAYLDPVGVGG